jgi:GNAT superfamily N-acetyltransferase
MVLGSSAMTAIFADPVSELVKIRWADPADVELIFSLICELAEYERARQEVTGNPDRLRHALFGPDPEAEAVIAECQGDAVGFALFYRTFSTWECRPGIWLEDLYVRPARRRSGVGGALLARVAEITLERGWARLEWAALNWNTPALDFYARLTARQLDEWIMHRLDERALERVFGPAG